MGNKIGVVSAFGISLSPRFVLPAPSCKQLRLKLKDGGKKLLWQVRLEMMPENNVIVEVVNTWPRGRSPSLWRDAKLPEKLPDEIIDVLCGKCGVEEYGLFGGWP